MKLLKLSIVVPVYNEASQLRVCLEAIAAQTVKPDEVVIVDNNSTDSSAEVALSYPFVRLVREERQGIVYARNAGFDAAGGDIICRIDADTVMPTYWVERIRQYYADGNQDRCFTGGAYFYNIRPARAVAWLYNWLAFDLNRWLIGHPTLWGSNMAITQRQWRMVRGRICQRSDIHEDLDLAIHLQQAGFEIFYDRNFRIGAYMRRVTIGRNQLWQYLNWWPRTLRLHNKPAWWLTWLIGCLVVYCLTVVLLLIENSGRWLGRLRSQQDLSTDRV